MVYEIGNYEFRRVSNDDVEDMLAWKYEGVYSFLIMTYPRVRLTI